MEEKTINEKLEEKREVISFRGYEDRYEIIPKEKFHNYRGRKIKKSWYNISNKICKKSFIYLGDADKDKGDIVYVDVINGMASKERADRKNINLEDLYKDSIVFVGYMKDDELKEEFTNMFNNI